MHGVFARRKDLLSRAEFVDLDDMMERTTNLQTMSV
jgi:hypothetical protein